MSDLTPAAESLLRWIAFVERVEDPAGSTILDQVRESLPTIMADAIADARAPLEEVLSHHENCVSGGAFLKLRQEARADLAARLGALLPGTIREYTGHPSTPDAEWGWAKFRNAVLAALEGTEP